MLLRVIKQAIDRWAIRAAARSLPKAHPPPDQMAEAMKLLQTPNFLTPDSTVPGVLFHDGNAFHFRSSRPTGPEENHIVHGRFFPAGASWKSRPFVLIVHGWNAEFHYLGFLPRVAREANRREMNAALLELPYHLHRRPRARDGRRDFICDDLREMLRVTAQALADMSGLLHWARAQGCPKTALWGFSLGGWLAGLHLCETAAQDAAALTTPIIQLDQAVETLEFCHPIRAALEVAPVPLRALNLTARKPRIPPDSIFLMQADYDLFVPAENYAALARAWSLPGWEHAPHSHISILASPRAMRRTIDWLNQRLVPK